MPRSSLHYVVRINVCPCRLTFVLDIKETSGDEVGFHFLGCHICFIYVVVLWEGSFNSTFIEGI